MGQHPYRCYIIYVVTGQVFRPSSPRLYWFHVAFAAAVSKGPISINSLFVLRCTPTRYVLIPFCDGEVWKMIIRFWIAEKYVSIKKPLLCAHFLRSHIINNYVKFNIDRRESGSIINCRTENWVNNFVYSGHYP